MEPIPEPLYKQADHPRLAVNAWRPDQGAERINDFILMSSGVTNGYVVTSDDGDVVINTGMPQHAARYRERFEQALDRSLNVVKIVFTQDHMDQTGGWQVFADPGAEPIGQRELEPLAAERALLGPFFGSRSRRILHAITQKIAKESGQTQPTLPPPVHPDHHIWRRILLRGRSTPIRVDLDPFRGDPQRHLRLAAGGRDSLYRQLHQCCVRDDAELLHPAR